MAYPDFTDDLVSQIKLDAYIPVAQGNFTDSQILSIADEMLWMTMCPELVSMDENWFMESVVSNFVANQADYTLPANAMWQKFKRVERISNGQVLPMTRIDVPDLLFLDTTGTGTPQSFFLQNNIITFWQTPAPGITDTFRIYYYRRPGAMVLKSAAAQVLSVNLATGEVTYTAVPPTTYTANSRHDFYSQTEPHRRFKTNIQATAIAGAVQTFPIADVQNLVAGDWVCITDQTVYPAIPFDLHSILKNLAIASLLKTQSDFETYNAQRAEILENMRMMMKAPGARIVANPKKLTLMGNRITGMGWWGWGGP